MAVIRHVFTNIMKCLELNLNVLGYHFSLLEILLFVLIGGILLRFVVNMFY